MQAKNNCGAKILVTCSLWLSLAMLGGCLSGCSNSQRLFAADSLHEPAKQQPVSSNQGRDFLQSGIFETNPKALQAWLGFTKDGRYRAANAGDFAFSEASKNELRELFGERWYPRINHPAITGDISRRNWFYDLAVIVVDTSRTDVGRFGVVIFDIPKEEKSPSIHWLFRGRDLSSALLSWHNNWPVLVFYHNDGSADPYYINWNEKTQEYVLDKDQKGLGARQNSRLLEKTKP